jgi:hypothetical protein
MFCKTNKACFFFSFVLCIFFFSCKVVSIHNKHYVSGITKCVRKIEKLPLKFLLVFLQLLKGFIRDIRRYIAIEISNIVNCKIKSVFFFSFFFFFVFFFFFLKKKKKKKKNKTNKKKKKKTCKFSILQHKKECLLKLHIVKEKQQTILYKLTWCFRERKI